MTPVKQKNKYQEPNDFTHVKRQVLAFLAINFIVGAFTIVSMYFTQQQLIDRINKLDDQQQKIVDYLINLKK